MGLNWTTALTVTGGAIATAIGGPGAGAAVGAGLSALTSGPAGGVDSQGRKWCPGRPTASEIRAVLQAATPNELAPVVRHWDQSRGREIGNMFAVDPDEIGYWLMGNRDCRHSDPNGITVQNTFLQLVRKYVGQGAGEIVYGAPQSGIDRTISAIKSGVGDFVGGVASGAASGAATAAQSGGAASQASSSLTQLLPLLVVGLAAVIILKK